jgi:hypothetical protein
VAITSRWLLPSHPPRAPNFGAAVANGLDSISQLLRTWLERCCGRCTRRWRWLSGPSADSKTIDSSWWRTIAVKDLQHESQFQKTPYLPSRPGASLQMPRSTPIAIERTWLTKSRQYAKVREGGALFQSNSALPTNTAPVCRPGRGVLVNFRIALPLDPKCYGCFEVTQPPLK